MALAAGSITITKVVSGTLSVTITRTSGGSLTVYSDAACTTSVSMPDSITATATYYLADPDFYDISVKRGGNEIASDSDAAITSQRIGGGRTLNIAPTVDPNKVEALAEGATLTGDNVFTGKQGIGGTPTVNLHVISDSTAQARIQRSSTDTSGSSLYFAKRRGTTDSPTVVASGDTLGEIYFLGYDGSTGRTAAGIYAQVDATPGSSDMPGSLSFLTTPDGSSSPLVRMKIDNAGLITGTGSSLGAWTSYTPTLGGAGGTALGNGTIQGYYCQIGKVVHFRARVILGSTSVMGTAATLTIPSTAIAGTNGAFNMNAKFIDASPANTYAGAATISSTTTFSLATIGTNGLLGGVTSTNPITWTTGDEIQFYGTYEAA